MREIDLINFRNKLLEIQWDVKSKIFDANLLLALYQTLNKSQYKTIHEMAELAFNMTRNRVEEIIVQGKKITPSERRKIVEYLDSKVDWPTIKEMIDMHIVDSIKLMGRENAYKHIGISLRTQQRYLKNIEGRQNERNDF